jgi:Ribbon-helix-helix protein, copG family
MKRTQLYLDEDIWKALHIQSRQRRTSISNLVRQAIRDRYVSSPADRSKAMQALVGMWRDRDEIRDSEKYVRRLRKGKRLRRIVL